jgi:hypothetical protein
MSGLQQPSSAPTDVFEHNPYRDHPALSELESELLWEYAKLAQHVKEVRIQSYLTYSYSKLITILAYPHDSRACERA